MNNSHSYETRLKQKMKMLKWQKMHLDPWLLTGLIALACVGLMILYSASNASQVVLHKQLLRLCLSFVLMFMFAQISPNAYKRWAPWIFTVSVFLLLIV